MTTPSSSIVIVGAGFTGTMTAVHLAQASTHASITLIERGERFGAGVAYSTPFDCHLLNVPAARLSALPHVPDDFLLWAQTRNAAVTSSSFLPRRVYSEYLNHTLDRASNSGAIRRVRAEVTRIARSGDAWRVECANGTHVDADAVVLALGNFSPANPRCDTPAFYTSNRYIRDPWAPGALNVHVNDDVLILGTGLTMIDAVLAMQEQGHRGRVIAVSRRGLLPQWHAADGGLTIDATLPESFSTWPRTARGLLHAVRREIAARGSWRSVIASLRSVTPDLWQGMRHAERRRFIRHVRPHWDTHRHCAAPSIGATIDRLIASGQLEIAAGTVERYDLSDHRVEAVIRRRHSSDRTARTVQRVINCTGPDPNIARLGSPLLSDLAENDTITADPLGIGIKTDVDGTAVNAHGERQQNLFVAGPLRRGDSWENFAIPELRNDAMRIARNVIAELASQEHEQATR